MDFPRAGANRARRWPADAWPLDRHITGVLTRLAGVDLGELDAVAPEDAAYVASK
jgi:hypothetical protein